MRSSSIGGPQYERQGVSSVATLEAEVQRLDMLDAVGHISVEDVAQTGNVWAERRWATGTAMGEDETTSGREPCIL